MSAPLAGYVCRAMLLSAAAATLLGQGNLARAQTVNTICTRVGDATYCSGRASAGATIDPYIGVNIQAQTLANQRAQQALRDEQLRETEAIREEQLREAQVRQQQDAFEEAQDRQLALDQRNRQIGSLMAAGRCDEARGAALQAGDFDLAGRVKELCSLPAEAAGTRVGSPPTTRVRKAQKPRDCGVVRQDASTVKIVPC
jgi:hypothetical protein